MLTTEQKSFIKDNYLTMSNKELAELLNVKYEAIPDFLYRNNLSRLVPFTLKVKEKLKKVPGYPLYQVSNYGRIKNIKRGNEVFPTVQKNYNQVIISLTNKGKRISLSLNRIVLTTFQPIENSDEYYVCHKDFDSFNNRLDNLFYLSKKEFFERISKINLDIHHFYSDEELHSLCKLLEEGKTYEEIMELTNNIFSYNYISQIKNRFIRRDISENYKF